MSSPTARKLAVALAISIGLNLFLGGMIASAWVVKRHFREHHPPVAGLAGGFDFRGGIEALGGDARPLAREIREAYRSRLRASGRAMFESRRAVGDLLRADEIDPAKLRAALAELRARSSEAEAVMHEALVDTMLRLTPDQRRRFLDAAMRGRGHRNGAAPD